MFDSIFSASVLSVSFTFKELLICSVCSLLMGAVAALLYTVKNRDYTRSFLMTLTLLPLVVQVVIMLVSNDVGVGIATAGAFALVRFRSAPGTAREITSIFLVMGIGLAVGAGYIGIGILLLAAYALCILVFALLGTDKTEKRRLRVTIPENMDYTGCFDDLFAKYTTTCELMHAKTTNMGSLFELSYELTFKPGVNEKEFLDAIRCRNSNLGVSCGKILPDVGTSL